MRNTGGMIAAEVESSFSSVGGLIGPRDRRRAAVGRKNTVKRAKHRRTLRARREPQRDRVEGPAEAGDALYHAPWHPEHALVSVVRHRRVRARHVNVFGRKDRPDDAEAQLAAADHGRETIAHPHMRRIEERLQGDRLVASRRIRQTPPFQANPVEAPEGVGRK